MLKAKVLTDVATDPTFFEKINTAVIDNWGLIVVGVAVVGIGYFLHRKYRK